VTSSAVIIENPVMFPPGCARLTTRLRSDRIGDACHDDRDSGGDTLDRLGCDRVVHDDHLGLGLNQIRDQLWYSIVIAVGISPLDDTIAPRDVVRVP